MAEAVVDGNLLSRFFCHKCSVEIERLLPDYRCPYCTSGFIEQLEGEGGGTEDGSMADSRAYLHNSSMDISGEDFSDFDLEGPNDDFDRMYLDVLEPLREMAELAPAANGETQRTRRSEGSNGRNPLQDRRNREMIQLRSPRLHVEHLVDNFMQNLTGYGFHHPTAQGGPAHPVLFLGNPGDYVWGRDGLDTIVTQLLNQMDGSGPPPLPRTQIDEIPTLAIVQSQVDIKLQCSICWEDFALAEPVRQLPCKHIYHTPCIEPWLELHGTCPICRQSLGDQTSAEANRDPVSPSLAALFRAANQAMNSRTSSSTSSSTSTSDE